MNNDVGGAPKREIDLIRESAGSMSLPPDLGNIVAMTPVGDRLYFVAEFGVSSAITADTIDPKRTNPDIPVFVQQTEITFGATTAFVRQALCTAMALFNKSYLPTNINCDLALEKALAITRDLASLADTVEELRANEASTRQGIAERKITARHLPRTPNLRGRCSQAIAHLRAIEVSISQIGQMFFPKEKPNDKWASKVTERASQYFGTDSENCKFMHNCLALFQKLADHRNSLIHPDDTKWVSIVDYEMNADGNLIAPTIEIVHPNSGVPRMDVVQFLSVQLENSAQAVEMILALMVEQSERSEHHVFEHHLATLPENERRAGSKYVWHTTIKSGAKFP